MIDVKGTDSIYPIECINLCHGIESAINRENSRKTPLKYENRLRQK